MSAHLDQFLEIVEREWGRPALLYIGDDFDRAYPTRERLLRALWHRRVLIRPDVPGWVIWQIHGYARVDGISGGVDLNIQRAAGAGSGGSVSADNR